VRRRAAVDYTVSQLSVERLIRKSLTQSHCGRTYLLPGGEQLQSSTINVIHACQSALDVSPRPEGTPIHAGADPSPTIIHPNPFAIIS
jgi:hypothetical protein